MHQRCKNPNHSEYAHYGGRGIKICRQWDDFWKFVEDMGDRPRGYTLDRDNNNGDYTPDNCRWTDTITQSLNKNKAKNNSSGYVRVISDPYNREPKRYGVKVNCEGKIINFGWYADVINAAYIADQIKLEFSGEGTPLNFLGNKPYYPEYVDS